MMAGIAQNNNAILFACSRCYSRHPFEELSSGQQLCKKCRGDYPVVKCTYCRSEFQQSKGSTASICKKCEVNVKQYGKPSSCEYCNIIAAFIGNRCQRCTNSEKKYGPPVPCEQCKQKCAFDRKDENKKVDGKLLCWLCTLSYKRALAKSKTSESSTRIVTRLTNNGNSTNKRDKPSRDKRRSVSSKDYVVSSSVKRPIRPDVTKLDSNTTTRRDYPSNNPSNNSHDDSLSHDGGPVTKKLNSSSSDMIMESKNSDHVGALTQLREQIASLQRQLSNKDKQLLEKDRTITELKAANFTTENELRTKLKSIQRDHESKVEILSNKCKELQKSVAVLNKTKGKSSLTIVSKITTTTNSPNNSHSPDTNDSN